jgi:hypothetical protein
VAYFIAFIPEILKGSQVTFLQNIALAKVNQTWMSAFIKGIGANWLVSLAVWTALASKDVSGKILGMWWSVMAFVVMGMTVSEARDYPSDANFIENQSMPKLKPGEFGTDEDNENNQHTGKPDGDMDKYLFNDSPIHPIEFNIIVDTNVQNRGATLEMNVYDIDLPGEVDEVYLNGRKIGTLTGANDKWGINRFTIPPGLLKRGKNLLQVFVDVKNEGWATSIDYAIISGLTKNAGGILRCWVAPTEVRAGGYVNFFAEVSGKPKSVLLYNGDVSLRTKLTDPDGDNIYSAMYRIPLYFGGKDIGWKYNFKVRAEGSWGVSWCPGVKVLKK